MVMLPWEITSTLIKQMCYMRDSINLTPMREIFQIVSIVSAMLSNGRKMYCISFVWIALLCLMIKLWTQRANICSISYLRCCSQQELNVQCTITLACIFAYEYRTSHGLWLDMIFIQRVVWVLSPSRGEGKDILFITCYIIFIFT